MLPDGLLGESVSQLLQLVAGHFLHTEREQSSVTDGRALSVVRGGGGALVYLSRHGGDAAQFNCSCQDIFAKLGVLWVLQVADAAADSVLIFHIRGLYLLVDMCKRAVKEDCFLFDQ